MASIVDKHTITATIEPLGIELAVKEATLVLDESRAPYAELTVSAPLLDTNSLNAIDLTDQELRLVGEIRQDFGVIWSLHDLTHAGGNAIQGITDLGGVSPSSITNTLFGTWNSINYPSQIRPFDLYVTGRRYIQVDKQIEIIATSDESKLIFDTIVSDTPLDPSSTDLATIAQLVLDRHDGTIEAGGQTATIEEAEATIWSPGVKAWDYLNTLTEPHGLRLWCDEAGKWYLTERQSTTPGHITIAPTSLMVDHDDSMEYNPEVWWDAVVIEYRWTDELNVEQVAYDYAGATVPRSSLVINYRDVVFPGPGAAQGILDRVQGKGRTITAKAVTRYSAQPGQSITLRPPQGFDQNGYIVGVTFRLPDAEMEITSRNLTEDPVTTWADPYFDNIQIEDFTQTGLTSTAAMTAVPGDTVNALTAYLLQNGTPLAWSNIPVSETWETIFN